MSKNNTNNITNEDMERLRAEMNAKAWFNELDSEVAWAVIATLLFIGLVIIIN